MADIVLNDKSIIPDEALLRKILGDTFPYFVQLENLSKEYSHEWKFYNKKSGWVYKVSDKKKALFWITPYSGNFNIGFAIRESEKDMLLNSSPSVFMKEKLVSAEKYPEGFALRFNIKEESELNELMVVLNQLMKLRR